MGDIAKVLTGVCSLGVREPNNARAEWSTDKQYAGDWSVKLTKTGTGNAGSTHLEATITPSVAKTLTTFVADPTDYGFWHYMNAVTGNFMQFELRFEDPDSDAWAEVTVVPFQGATGTAAWLQYSAALTDAVGFGGIGELGASFFDWDLGTTIADIITDIDLDAAVTDCGPWQLARIRVELWESAVERHCFIDSLEIDGTVYTVEPGGTVPGMSLSSPYVDIGYTEDGADMTYTAEGNDIEVAEETVPIDWALTKETIDVVCNMAEASLANLAIAMSGSLLSGNILRVGAGGRKVMNIRLQGLTPEGYLRQIFLPKVITMGAVGVPFKKGVKTIVPVTFHALKPKGEDAYTVVDNEA